MKNIDRRESLKRKKLLLKTLLLSAFLQSHSEIPLLATILDFWLIPLCERVDVANTKLLLLNTNSDSIENSCYHITKYDRISSIFHRDSLFFEVIDYAQYLLTKPRTPNRFYYA